MKIILTLILIFGILTSINVLLFVAARKLKAGNKFVICMFILFINSILFDFMV